MASWSGKCACHKYETSQLERLRRLKFHGLGEDAYDRDTQGRSAAQEPEPGYKYNMTDISAALGSMQLARVDDFNRKRTELAMRYRERLSEVDGLLPLADPTHPIRHAWHLFIPGKDRFGFVIASLNRRAG